MAAKGYKSMIVDLTRGKEIMMDNRSDSEELFKVLINDEEQYSLWPMEKDIPQGWKQIGPSGTKEECLGYVKVSWTDMRPKSLRQ